MNNPQIQQRNHADEQIRLLASIDKKLQMLNNPPIWKSFFQGLLMGLGTVIGATLLFALLVGVLRNFITTPIIGEWINDIVEIVENR
jgi:hypothetical protein